jgi:hypothetical protein
MTCQLNAPRPEQAGGGTNRKVNQFDDNILSHSNENVKLDQLKADAQRWIDRETRRAKRRFDTQSLIWLNTLQLKLDGTHVE